MRSLRTADAVGSAAQATFAAARHHWRAFLFGRAMRGLAGKKLLRVFADAYPEAFFIEIGANDGEQFDPLRPFIVEGRWRGIMVEPVPTVFELLRRNYEHLDRVVLENAAIADRDGRMPFYEVIPPKAETRREVRRWHDALGSLSRETVLLHAASNPEFAGEVTEIEVPCLTFDSLLRKHDVEGFDLLVIDTEGYDYEIIKRINFSAHRPRLLVYEHCLLSPDERNGCRTLMESFGFATMEEFLDTWCLDVRCDDRVTRAWHRLRPTIPGVSYKELAALREAQA